MHTKTVSTHPKRSRTCLPTPEVPRSEQRQTQDSAAGKLLFQLKPALGGGLDPLWNNLALACVGGTLPDKVRRARFPSFSWNGGSFHPFESFAAF